MRLIRSGIFALLIPVASACASASWSRGAREATKKPPVGGVAEFRVTSFDGHVLTGRVLVGAKVDPLVVDRRLIEWISVKLENIRACDTGELLKHFVFEAFARRPKPEDISILLPGDWYGREVRYFLFDTGKILRDKSGMIEPDCFEADLVVRDVDMLDAARLPIRIVRTDKSAPPGGGAASPMPPPSDAGTP